ncbi:hypothetical protein J2Z22_000670 [Paenibacillus forsythiae]|uniref:Uncharacterized protein n=1 Tax=Paenibacillus forsythiae TaxID=365616 RepID=A0ABU3H2Y0_9BACL|nr:hypothetical protein [Paenibacillus forsythiae]MDT3425157.1 hypothetical protein [Paenibacillus forsythiae]
MSLVNQLRNTFMSRYGLTEDIIHKETIDVTGPDPVHFSAMFRPSWSRFL